MTMFDYSRSVESGIRQIVREEIAKAFQEREHQVIEANADAVAAVVITRLIDAQRRAQERAQVSGETA